MNSFQPRGGQVFSSFIGETHHMFCFFPVWIFPSGSSMSFATLDLHIETHAEIFIQKKWDDILILF